MPSYAGLVQKQVPTRRLWVFPHVAPTVFLGAAVLILGTVALGLAQQHRMLAAASGIHAWIAANLGWFYTGAVAVFPAVCIALALSRFGRMRLGDPEERPRYGRLTWFAMLFSAGMGIGLLFWSVAEPISHYVAPPWGEPATEDAGRIALRLTFFHWGLHAWAIYVVTAMGLAFFTFRHKLPLSLRSIFYPLVGDRIYGVFGDVVDVFAVLGTMFGVATSLGLGVLQVNAGLDYLLGIGQSRLAQVLLIAGITAAATASVVSGLDKGIALLSRLNVLAAMILLATVLALGPTAFLLDAFLEATGEYLQNIVQLSLWTQATGDGQWQADWTLFYWGWWISWSPFVGTFIARVSRGRTIREFVLGVLLVPTAAVLLWMTVFGATAIYMQHTGQADLAPFVDGGTVSQAFFALLDVLPAAEVTAALATLIIVLFFVTSSDSGSLVIDMLTAGGHTDPPKVQRVFWAVTEGVVAATLLLGGGLQALQTAAITSGLPIAVILLLMCYTLYRGLATDRIPSAGAAKEPVSPDVVMGLEAREQAHGGPAASAGE
jgi:choline/glycine/proline betaine transport protein